MINRNTQTLFFQTLLLLGFLCSIPAFLFCYHHVLNLFYVTGCPLEDQGICAYLMWRNDFYVQLPPAIGEIWGTDYFPAHFSLIFSLTSFISKIVDIGMIEFFALFHGLSHGLLALSLFYLFARLYKLTTPFHIILSFVLSILFSFSGLSVSSMYYPHYEMLFIPLAGLFLGLLVQKRPLVALPFFILCLTIRECSGFHLLSILFFLILIDYFYKKKIYKPFLYYAAAALVFSVTAVIIQKILRNGGLSNLSDMYLGSPPYAHLTWDLLKERVFHIYTTKGHFYVPLVIITLWSIVSKRYYLLLGIVAALPWFLFNFLALATWPAGLYFYYGIFYLLIFFWPLLAIREVYEDNITQSIKNEVLKWYSLIILAAVFFNNPINLNDFYLKPEVSQNESFYKLQTLLNHNIDQLGKTYVDAQVASLAPNQFSKKQILYLRNVPVEERRKFFGYLDPKIIDNDKADTVIYYNYYNSNNLNYFYTILSELPFLYRLNGTYLYLATRKSPNEIPAFASLMTLVDYPHDQKLKSFYLSEVFQNVMFRNDVRWDQGNIRVPLKGGPGIAIYTKPVLLPKGKYCVNFEVQETQVQDVNKPILTIDVAIEDRVVAKEEVFTNDKNKIVNFCFPIESNQPHAYYSIRVWDHQNAEILLRALKLSSSD